MNALFSPAKQLMLEGGVNWLTDSIYGILLNLNAYTFSQNHASLADIDESAFIASSGYLTGRSSANGVADADDLLFSTVIGPVAGAMILVKDGGTAITSKLIAYIDQAVGLPFTPTGGNLLIEFDNGPAKIFAL